MRIFWALFFIGAIAAESFFDQFKNKALAGGWSQADTALCANIWKDKVNKNFFEGYEVVDCWTQVVSGTNYGIVLRNEKEVIQQCFFVIYKPINGPLTFVSNNSNEPDSCIKLFNEKVKENN